jgi:CheY-like chemotaxis protein
MGFFLLFPTYSLLCIEGMRGKGYRKSEEVQPYHLNGGGPCNMAKQAATPTVLIADDSPDDCLIAMRAWEESRLGFDVRFVHDGRELLDYLYRRRKYRNMTTRPWPWLILLDLNMPRKDGRKVLVELRSHPDWRHIPTVVFSDSTRPQDKPLKNINALSKN